MTPSPSLEQLIGLLVERANHLEDLLVSSLFGFLLTTTFTIFGAAYVVRGDSEKTSRMPVRQMYVGVSVLYALLSGYYYFMLAQFYATFITVGPLAERAGVSMDTLWTTLRLPNFGLLPDSSANFLMLLSAPTFPLLFSALSLVAVRQFVHGHGGARDVGWFTFIACLAVQLLVCALLIFQPFVEFSKAIGALP